MPKSPLESQPESAALTVKVESTDRASPTLIQSHTHAPLSQQDSGSIKTPLQAGAGEHMTVPHRKTRQPLANKRGKVLLVDDDPEILDILELYLEALDLQCQKATSGQEALLKANSFHPDLFVLDAFLPGMTGFQICQKLRQCSEFQQTPIFFLSSNEEEEHVVNAYRSGADDYMTKPFNPKTLGMKIKKAVECQLEQRASCGSLVGLPSAT